MVMEPWLGWWVVRMSVTVVIWERWGVWLLFWVLADSWQKFTVSFLMEVVAREADHLIIRALALCQVGHSSAGTSSPLSVAARYTSCSLVRVSMY